MEAKKLLASSADSSELSLTIKGILVGLPAVLIAMFKLFHIQIADSDVVNLVQNIDAILSLTITTIGGVRKAWNAIKVSLGF